MAIPDFDKAELLLPMDGANAGTIFADKSLRHRIVTRSGVVTSTAQFKFAAYGSSALFASTGQFLNAGAAPDWAFLHRGDTAYTVECWVRPDTTGDDRVIFDTGGVATGTVGAAAWITNNGTLRFAIGRGTSGTFAANAGSSIGAVSNGVWQHLRFTATNGAIAAFVDGVSVATATMSSPSTANPAHTLFVGRYGVSNALRYAGHMQDFAIFNGVNRGALPVPDRMAAHNLTRTNSGTDSHTIDRAIVFYWGGTGFAYSVIPDIGGNFTASDLVDLEYGVAMITDGCDPVTRGPIAVDPD
jgi:hypothetical protein